MLIALGSLDASWSSSSYFIYYAFSRI